MDIPSRVKKNQDLYKSSQELELEVEDVVNSNEEVIAENQVNIDLNQVKELLEEQTKRKNNNKINYENSITDMPELEVTSKQDINEILEQARDNSGLDYDKERLRKLRNTQYDILKNLNIITEQPLDDTESKELKEKLVDLINTITLNEKNDIKPLDILTDLKGDDDTEVIEPIVDPEQEIKKELTEEIKRDIKKETGAINSTETVMEDFDDLKDDLKRTGILIKILVIIFIIILLLAIFLVLNKVLDWNLF